MKDYKKDILFGEKLLWTPYAPDNIYRLSSSESKKRRLENLINKGKKKKRK
jgi:hypothetical protein